MSIQYNHDCIDCLFYDVCHKQYNIKATTPACESFELLHEPDHEVHYNHRY